MANANNRNNRIEQMIGTEANLVDDKVFQEKNNIKDTTAYKALSERLENDGLKDDFETKLNDTIREDSVNIYDAIKGVDLNDLYNSKFDENEDNKELASECVKEIFSAIGINVDNDNSIDKYIVDRNNVNFDNVRASDVAAMLTSGNEDKVFDQILNDNTDEINKQYIDIVADKLGLDKENEKYYLKTDNDSKMEVPYGALSHFLNDTDFIEKDKVSGIEIDEDTISFKDDKDKVLVSYDRDSIAEPDNKFDTGSFDLDGAKEDIANRIKDVLHNSDNVGKLKIEYTKLQNDVDKAKQALNKVSGNIEKIETKAGEIEKVSKHSYKYSGLYHRNVFAQAAKLEGMWVARQEGLQFDGKFVSAGEIFAEAFRFINGLTLGNILYSALEIAIYKHVDKIMNKDDLEEYHKNGFVEKKENIDTGVDKQQPMNVLVSDKAVSSPDNVDQDRQGRADTTVSKADFEIQTEKGKFTIDKDTRYEFKNDTKEAFLVNSDKVVKVSDIKDSFMGVDVSKGSFLNIVRYHDNTMIKDDKITFSVDGKIDNKPTTVGYITFDIKDKTFEVRDCTFKHIDNVEGSQRFNIDKSDFGKFNKDRLDNTNGLNADEIKKYSEQMIERIRPSSDEISDKIDSIKDTLTVLMNDEFKDSLSEEDKNTNEQVIDKYEGFGISLSSSLDGTIDEKLSNAVYLRDICSENNHVFEDVKDVDDKVSALKESYSDKYSDVEKSNIKSLIDSRVEYGQKDKELTTLRQNFVDKSGLSEKDKSTLKDKISSDAKDFTGNIEAYIKDGGSFDNKEAVKDTIKEIYGSEIEKNGDKIDPDTEFMKDVVNEIKDGLDINKDKTEINESDPGKDTDNSDPQDTKGPVEYPEIILPNNDTENNEEISEDNKDTLNEIKESIDDEKFTELKEYINVMKPEDNAIVGKLYQEGAFENKESLQNAIEKVGNNKEAEAVINMYNNAVEASPKGIDREISELTVKDNIEHIDNYIKALDDPDINDSEAIDECLAGIRTSDEYNFEIQNPDIIRSGHELDMIYDPDQDIFENEGLFDIESRIEILIDGVIDKINDDSSPQEIEKYTNVVAQIAKELGCGSKTYEIADNRINVLVEKGVLKEDNKISDIVHEKISDVIDALYPDSDKIDVDVNDIEKDKLNEIEDGFQKDIIDFFGSMYERFGIEDKGSENGLIDKINEKLESCKTSTNPENNGNYNTSRAQFMSNISNIVGQINDKIENNKDKESLNKEIENITLDNNVEISEEDFDKIETAFEDSILDTEINSIDYDIGD